jgi:type IV secretion system protein VirD4
MNEHVAGEDKSAARSTKLTTTVAFLAFVGLFNLALTQWIAYRLDYHPALGSRWFAGLYQPFAWIGWQRWYDNAATTFNIAYLAVLVGLLVGIAGAVLYLGFRTRSARQHESLHGTAHWATEDEVRASGLLPAVGNRGAGVYVGGWTNPKTGDLHYLRHDGPEHIAAVAPTRSGKGVGLVVPTCLSGCTRWC